MSCADLVRSACPARWRRLPALVAVGAGAWITVVVGACSSDLPSGGDDLTEDRIPVVSRVEPRTLPRGATLDLRVFGAGFDPASRVRLRAQGAPGNAVVTNSTRFVSSGELTANVTTAADAPAVPYEVVVTNGAGKQGVGTELVDFGPQIVAISPSTAERGEAVNISGSGFGLDMSSVRVTFDGREASVVSVRERMVVAAVPRGVALGRVVVEVSVTGFSIPAFGAMEITDPIPQISGISPSTAEPGEVVTISGSRFGRVGDEPGATKVFVSAPPGTDIEVPQLIGNPDRMVIAVPWQLPEGTAAVRVVSPYSAVPAEERMRIVRRSAVPNVAGWYNIVEGFACDVLVTQNGTTVTLAPACDFVAPGLLPLVSVAGTLSQDGQFRGQTAVPGHCEHFRLILTFSETGYRGFAECEQLGVLEREQWNYVRMGPDR